jgi:predicted transposase YbfD/YdcC
MELDQCQLKLNESNNDIFAVPELERILQLECPEVSTRWW